MNFTSVKKMEIIRSKCGFEEGIDWSKKDEYW